MGVLEGYWEKHEERGSVVLGRLFRGSVVHGRGVWGSAVQGGGEGKCSAGERDEGTGERTGEEFDSREVVVASLVDLSLGSEAGVLDFLVS